LDVDAPGFQEWYAHYHTTLVAASTLRILLREWPNLALRLPKAMVGPSTWDPGPALRLGQAMNRLHRYELPLGVSQLHDIVLDDPPLYLHPLLTSMTAFIERQRTPEGWFGFLADEQAAHALTTDGEEEFYKDIVTPISEICEEYLAWVRDIR
jgi:hypothetical protein